jgi:multisubunit Na+/H+ antiporter MnhB subunit
MSFPTEKGRKLSNIALGTLVILGILFVVTGEWVGAIAGGLLVAVSAVIHLLMTEHEWKAESTSPNTLIALAALCIAALVLAETVWHIWGADDAAKTFLPHEVLMAVRRICLGIAACMSLLAVLEALIGTTAERRN